ncbi:MAG TPA: HsmA family protein [Rectinemataceae bacterium]|nr:HsmA family protein [Rectinemataceae bacterium]
MLPIAAATITLAMVFYSIAVWWERAMGKLRGRHLLLFWLGLACDTTGTTLMGKMAGSAFELNFHGIAGLLAILLMLFHSAWATVVHASRAEEPKLRFHRLSVAVWAVWLVPYVSGMIYGMSRIR